MPLFGSQQGRNKRLFDRLFFAFTTAARQTDWDGHQRENRDAMVAVYAGGSSAANRAVETCEPLKRAWGNGEERQGAVLTTIFTMPMILRFCRWSRVTSAMNLAARSEWIRHRLWVALQMCDYDDLPVSREATLKEYMEVVKQFEFEEDAAEGGQRCDHWIEMDYLLSRACLALGLQTRFSLGQAALPVPSLYEFSRQGGVPGMSGNDIEIHAAMFDSVHIGASVSAKVWKDLTELDGQ